MGEAVPVTHPSFGPDPNRGVAADDLEVADADARSENGAAKWDEMYASSGQVWSGQPNLVLVAEAAHLKPGRALDVACGEGADAVWLARQG
jgi:ubiquinone/menaquinone biosynthesis C-methylase UbiE